LVVDKKKGELRCGREKGLVSEIVRNKNERSEEEEKVRIKEV